MSKKFEIRWADVQALIRTAAALLLGNCVVVPVLLDKIPPYWWCMPVAFGGMGMLGCLGRIKSSKENGK